MGPSHLTAVTPPSKKKKGGKTHHRKPSVSYGRQAEQQHLLSQESTSSTPDTAWTALHFLIHQSSASPANLMCPSPLMKTATQTCPAVSQGCVGGGSLYPSQPLTPHHRRRVLMLFNQSIQKKSMLLIHLAAASRWSSRSELGVLHCCTLRQKKKARMLLLMTSLTCAPAYFIGGCLRGERA